MKKAANFIGHRIEDMRLDVREIQTITVDANEDGIPDMAISDALADKKQGENEREAVEEVAAKNPAVHRGR